MLFSEIYCAYFNTVAAIISKAQKESISEKDILQTINEKAFSESMLTILPAIKNEEWLILDKTFHTPIKKTPQMPLTLLQKQWMKALLSDPRITLFDVDTTGLEDVEPLFSFDNSKFFDRHADSDPYTDEKYISHFKTILCALKEKRRIHIKFQSRKGRSLQGRYIPYRLEYSAKDDKFRLETAGGKYSAYINLSRIETCILLEPYAKEDLIPPKHKEHFVTFTLKDERNALDRVMIHFSDCHKETIRIENNLYKVKLWYDVNDETEILIRLLSFGPMLQVTEPESFIGLIRNRLSMQYALK
jgi:hypothetical protein